MDTTIPVVRGFRERVETILNDDFSSPKTLFELLVLQPLFITHLFMVANEIRQNSKSKLIRRPQSVEAIISTLGYHGVILEIDHIEDVSPDQASSLFRFSAHAYSFACVLALMAAVKFGRTKAPIFFLYGILSESVKERADILLETETEPTLEHYLTFGNDPKIPLLIEEASRLIESFEKQRSPEIKTRYRLAWEEALRKIEGLKP